MPEFRGRFLYLLRQGLQLLLLPLQYPLLLESLKLEIARLERIILFDLFLLMVEITILKLLAIGVLELVEVSVLLQGSHNLTLEWLLEEGFQHGQIDLCVRHLVEDVVVAKLGTLIFLPLLVVPRLLSSFLSLKSLALDSS